MKKVTVFTFLLALAVGASAQSATRVPPNVNTRPNAHGAVSGQRSRRHRPTGADGNNLDRQPASDRPCWTDRRGRQKEVALGVSEIRG
jgi:hypothetical protein